MTYKDYESELQEYRKKLCSKEWFLDKQVESWKSTENQIGHLYSNSIVFVSLFLLGGLSLFLLIKGTDLEKSGYIFWGRFLHCLIFLTVGLSVYLVGLQKKSFAAAFYVTHIMGNITRNACLEELDRYEYDLLSKFHSLTFSINAQIKCLNEIDLNNTVKYNSAISTLSEFSEMLHETEASLAALRNIRNSYIRDDCFDFDLHNSIIEYRK